MLALSPSHTTPAISPSFQVGLGLPQLPLSISGGSGAPYSPRFYPLSPETALQKWHVENAKALELVEVPEGMTMTEARGLWNFGKTQRIGESLAPLAWRPARPSRSLTNGPWPPQSTRMRTLSPSTSRAVVTRVSSGGASSTRRSEGGRGGRKGVFGIDGLHPPLLSRQQETMEAVFFGEGRVIERAERVRGEAKGASDEKCTSEREYRSLQARATRTRR
jgi:hypothetical protein